MNFILIYQGSFKIKKNINLDATMALLHDTYSGDWDIRGNNKDVLPELMTENYIMIHVDFPDVLFIKANNVEMQIPKQHFREEVGKMLSRRIIKEFLL